MTNEQREIHRKKRVLEHAERIGNVNRTCLYFGVARSTFYLWRARYRELGDEVEWFWKKFSGELDAALKAD